MKKQIGILLALALTVGTVSGCGTETQVQAGDSAQTSSEQKITGTITVMTREDGSGTRGAFTELTGVLEDDIDYTTVEASVYDSTGKIMVAVANNPNAMGYISLGSLNETVKAIGVDGVMPTVETVADGSYTLARPFNIATAKDGAKSDLTAEFLAFIFSAEGQNIAEDNGFIKVEDGGDFASDAPSGVLTIGGSTSVYPLMEKLKEAYMVHNENATITIEGVGSSGGMSGAADGTFDIGMASRDMKDSELEVLDGVAIALDGIAMIVNVENTLDSLTTEQIRAIYVGEIEEYDTLG